MSDTESKPAHVQTEAVSEKPRKSGIIKNHCKRFWWLHLIVVCIGVAIVTPVLLLVGVPKIAQDKINHAKLQLDGITMTNPTPEGFTMKIDTVIRGDGIINARVEPFTAAMSVKGGDSTPFALVDFPQASNKKFQVYNVTQQTKIGNMEAFTDFNKKLLSSTEFEVEVEGKTGIHAQGINRRYPVNFKKTIPMAGLQTFAGTTVFNHSIEMVPDENGHNFFGWTRIPNRSIVSFEVGNATFNTFLNGENIGKTFLYNLNLKPGNDNVFTLRGAMNRTAVILAMQQKPYCNTDTMVPVVLVGEKVVYNGKEISYFADALAADKQTVPIDLKTPLRKLFGGKDLACLDDSKKE